MVMLQVTARDEGIIKNTACHCDATGVEVVLCTKGSGHETKVETVG